MGKSARILGYEFGRTGREMNGLLKEHGYLEGRPGDYELTDKGQRYADEQYHHRGTGGYASYNADWTTRTWNDETAAALRADMSAPAPLVDPAPEENVEFVTPPTAGEVDHPWTTNEAVVYAAVLGVLLIAPHLKPLWNERLQPRVAKVRTRLSRPRVATAERPGPSTAS